eukprot:TRINITY_DN178_c0_g3_i7.p2 TRINITY_DN178_c0_g3~~TRINITY_DN178_c0_g3_i7.p2  ORF type:complete len:110 (-),score=2.76 TRINITY_DN178_c0_g3_i7:507-836(-)
MRGSRQGDPISGYLFNIALDVLNHMVLSELSSSLLKVFDAPIPSLMYCDDTVLCFKNSLAIPSTLELLDNFATISRDTVPSHTRRVQHVAPVPSVKGSINSTPYTLSPI